MCSGEEVCRPLRVVVAEDDRSTAALLEAFLEQEDDLELCALAGDGWQALEFIERERPDVVLTDLIMPGLDGLGLLRALSTLPAPVRPKVVVLSGVGEDAYIQRCIALGASYYLVKPASLSSLSLRLRELFPARSGRRRLSPDLALEEMGAARESLGFRQACYLLERMESQGEDGAMKGFYLDAAQAFHTSYSCVERNLRTLVKRVHSRGSGYYTRTLGFGGRERPPENGVFLRTLFRALH